MSTHIGKVAAALMHHQKAPETCLVCASLTLWSHLEGKAVLHGATQRRQCMAGQPAS